MRAVIPTGALPLTLVPAADSDVGRAEAGWPQDEMIAATELSYRFASPTSRAPHPNVPTGAPT